MHQIKQIAEILIPRKYLRVVGLYVTKTISLFMRGEKLACTCCGFKGKKFLSYGLIPRANALCPNCLSLERHRLMKIYLETKTNIYSNPKKKVLHFAPEHQLQIILNNHPEIDYLSADIDMPTAMEKIDITQINKEDNTFDVVICNHVLEHIPDDIKAMSEIYRVMKPGAWAILQTPLDNNANTTIEDPNETNPKIREQKFGQNDHVRIYGLDKKQRLEKVGFNVKVDDFVFQLPKELIEKYALMPDEYIYFCTKPN